MDGKLVLGIAEEDLPLNLWNKEIFDSIGEVCGGLIEVDPETEKTSSIPEARLRVKGFWKGFILENLMLQMVRISS